MFAKIVAVIVGLGVIAFLYYALFVDDSESESKLASGHLRPGETEDEPDES